MKNILLFVHRDDGQEARLRAVLDLVRTLNGHLVCLDVTLIPEVVGDYAGKVAAMLEDERESETTNKAALVSRLHRENVSFDWIDQTGFLPDAIEAHVGLADLVVLSRDEEETLFPKMVDMIGALVVHLGKPILVVPPTSAGIHLEGHALVAWDGSEDVEAALRSLIPVLQISENVTLFNIDDGSMEAPIEGAAQYLLRHDIKTIIETEPGGRGRPGASIWQESRRYDYVVMGAYSRHAALETIFGGATRTMMRTSKVPVFFAHRL